MKATPYEFPPFDPTEDWNGKDIWIYRGGGYGDLMLVTPLIRELRRRWQKVRVHVACGQHYWPLFDGIDVFLEKIPIPYEKVEAIHGFLCFEELVEGNPKGQRFHMAQLWADQAGIVLDDIRPEYHLSEDERKWAIAKYPRSNGLPRIGIQVLASAMVRTYPKMTFVINDLAKEAEVFLFGSPKQVELKEPIPNLRNLMEDSLSFRESAAVLSTCDSCVTPDSAMVHLASALDVPAICLYGPFPANLRLTSVLATAFEGKAPCAPCFYHSEIFDELPAGMPCEKAKYCVALAAIDHKEVVKAALEAAKG